MFKASGSARFLFFCGFIVCFREGSKDIVARSQIGSNYSCLCLNSGSVRFLIWLCWEIVVCEHFLCGLSDVGMYHSVIDQIHAFFLLFPYVETVSGTQKDRGLSFLVS